MAGVPVRPVITRLFVRLQAIVLCWIGAMLYRLSSRTSVSCHRQCTSWLPQLVGRMRPPRSSRYGNSIDKHNSLLPASAAAAGPGVSTAAPKAKTTQKAAAAGSSSGGPWLIVGLGNPGPRYDDTRHNVGFMVVDALAASLGADMRKLEKSAAVGKGELRGVPVILAKPVTFMNNSGDAVAALARFYKVPHQRILVISDDLDQPLAAVRLRAKGGHGGHNGLRSIIACLGNTHDFPRLKIGIGRPPGQMDVAGYVLQPFRAAERGEVDTAISEALRVIDAILALGLDKALSGQRL